MSQCEACIVLTPESTDEERRCTKEVGKFSFHGSYGFVKLCDSHATSYQKFGYELTRETGK